MYARDYARIATPIGIITIAAEGTLIISLTIGDTEANAPQGHSDILQQAKSQLEEWFAGSRTAFDLPLAPLASPRGEALRAGMRAIGYGETLSYGALARSLASSPRAIGQACARNPLPIIIPCHRVLGAGNALGAYSAGAGPATKAWLLAH